MMHNPKLSVVRVASALALGLISVEASATVPACENLVAVMQPQMDNTESKLDAANKVIDQSDVDEAALSQPLKSLILDVSFDFVAKESRKKFDLEIASASQKLTNASDDALNQRINQIAKIFDERVNTAFWHAHQAKLNEIEKLLNPKDAEVARAYVDYRMWNIRSVMLRQIGSAVRAVCGGDEQLKSNAESRAAKRRAHRRPKATPAETERRDKFLDDLGSYGGTVESQPSSAVQGH